MPVKTEAGAQNQMTFREVMVEYGSVIVFGALLLFNIIVTPNFLSLSTILLIVKQSTSLLFVAVGMTIVISAGGTDISAGSMMALSGIIVALGLRSGGNFYVYVLISLAVCACIGAFNGVLIAKTGVQPIILTLVMQIAIRGLAVLIANSKVYSLSKYPIIAFLGLKRFADVVPVQAIFFVLVAALGLFLVRKTVFGKYVEGIGGNARAARLAGVRTTMVIISVYVASTLFAGCAGILEMARNGALDPNELGKLFELDAIAAVAIGGTSMKGGKARMLGSIMGCVIMTMIGTTVNMNGVPFAVSNLIKAAIIIGSLMIQREKNT
ncbi:MAG: ABC transporter permease [Oscillospiraceae bacterium]|nr:ABC transporter permease [Oscillospiraceae bacterium]